MIYSIKNATPRELLRLVRQEVQTTVSGKENKQTSVISITNTLLNRCNPGSTQDFHPVCIYPLNRFPSTQGERDGERRRNWREQEIGQVVKKRFKWGRSPYTRALKRRIRRNWQETRVVGDGKEASQLEQEEARLEGSFDVDGERLTARGAAELNLRPPVRPALRFPRTVGKLSRSSSSLLNLHLLLSPFPYRSVSSGLSNSTLSLSLSRHNVRQLPGNRRHPQGLCPRWFAVRQEMHQAYVDPWLYIARDLVNWPVYVT